MKGTKYIDTLKRPLKDLRISVTDRCNFRCSYCMPAEVFGPDFAFLPRSEMLNFDEIKRLATIFVHLGVEKVRLTGGEPLMRKDLPLLVSMLTSIEGLRDIALTTNGIFLPKHAKALKDAGLKRVNVSLDALDSDLFQQINGRGVQVKPVLKGIDAARRAGLGVKINMVVKKGLNDSQILPMASHFKNEGITLRFIEFMDVGSTNGWNYEQVISKKEIHNLIHNEYPLEVVEGQVYGDVAKRYRYVGTNTEVGFISSVTETFCSSCTRARISTEGKLYTCLFAETGFDIRKLLRDDAMTDEDISDAIVKVWERRADRYSDERTEESARKRKIEMSYIGG
ncbi:GTP 3',8-cyclase MoaA [Bacillus sp. HMF5848]|uniref:GTP 3',8-cyclase MoaA n=1 Tax=Bacillus sp. HMF5848 TaxID=2495421 RepID=UPI000F767611|nr:GTP 3',8-cyclase MoaA [Bacillus sp. HMF5848]RSK27941.1 GTP 3',8-cyclase MoaA [Bacillus sp. HMF5848]